MEEKVTTESGLQLIARLHKRPSLVHLDDILFPDGPNPGDVIQISGESTVGKSLLLMKFLTKCLLPKTFEGADVGGLQCGVILINTDHDISILKLVSLMEEFLYNACVGQFDKGTGKTIEKTTDLFSLNDFEELNEVTVEIILRYPERLLAATSFLIKHIRYPSAFISSHFGEKSKILKNADTIENVIKQSLKNLIVLNTYSSLQLEMNFHSLEKILSRNSNMSLLVIDSLTTYYWSDVTNEKSIKKMDLYLKVIIEKLKKCINEFRIVTIFVIQEYFRTKQKEYSSSLVSHKIELKKNEESDTYTAYIDTQNSSYQYTLSEKGFTWVV